ncbi:sugar transferase [Shimia aestuarii]|nr:sugar transferase [Shimia aestuarii]
MKIEAAALYGQAVPTEASISAVRKASIERENLLHGYNGFFVAKRALDWIFAILVFPTFLVITAILFLVNPLWNRGPVFFRQVRMGRGGKPFTMWKFRTMTENGVSVRAADAPLDTHRITPLGRMLRRTKLDELPNILNIFSGDMSLVGPRPDAFDHACEYIAGVPHYCKRFTVRPGITGLAQVRGGYADNRRAVARKARYDTFYIKNSSLRMELYVISLTFVVVFSGFGQR